MHYMHMLLFPILHLVQRKLAESKIFKLKRVKR